MPDVYTLVKDTEAVIEDRVSRMNEGSISLYLDLERGPRVMSAHIGDVVYSEIQKAGRREARWKDECRRQKALHLSADRREQRARMRRKVRI